MKAKDENMKFVLRYGSIFIVIFTFVGITTMLSKISIKNKIPMEIVLYNPQNETFRHSRTSRLFS